MHSAPSAVTLTVLLAVFSLFQLALILGAPVGQYAFGGQNKRLNGGQRFVSLIAIVVSAVAAAVALSTVGIIGETVRSTGMVVAMWIFAAVALFVTLKKAKSESRPERTVMSTLSAAVFGLALVVAFGL